MSESSNSGTNGDSAAEKVVEEALAALDDPEADRWGAVVFLKQEVAANSDSIPELKKILSKVQALDPMRDDGEVDTDLAGQRTLAVSFCCWKIATLSSDQELADSLANGPATNEEATAFVEQIRVRLKKNTFAPAELQKIITGLENIHFVSQNGTALGAEDMKALAAECRKALASGSKAKKTLSEKQLLKEVRKFWKQGLPAPKEIEGALTAMAPDFHQNKVLLSVATAAPSEPRTADAFLLTKGGPQYAQLQQERYALAKEQRKRIVFAAESEINAVYFKVQPTAIDPNSPTYKQDVARQKKNLGKWKDFLIEHRALFEFFPILEKCEDSINESLRTAHALPKNPEKPREDPLSQLRAAWDKGRDLSDYEELLLCDSLSKPENITLLAEVAGFAIAGDPETQQERIVSAGKPAVEKICGEALREAHAYSRETSKTAKKEGKGRLQAAQKTLSGMQGLAFEFPEIKTATDAVEVSLGQSGFSNEKTRLASSLIEQEAPIEVLKSISPSPGVVTGFFARDRIGQLLTSNNISEETEEWAVNYLGDCIRRAPGEKRAKAISIFLQEAAAVPLARQMAIAEAASIASRMPHADQRKISDKIHSFSRKAGQNSPEKTLFEDFAKEMRKDDGVDPKLFPATVEERQKAGGKFAKDTTVIMETFHASLENAERAEGAHPLEELLEGLGGLPEPKPAPKPPTGKVVLDRTVLFTPQTLAAKFERGEKIALEELEPKIFAGQPAHRVLNAVNVLMSAKIPEVENDGKTVPDTELETVRNRLATSLLSELGEEDVLPFLEKRQGGKMPDGVPPRILFSSMLMNMHDDTEGLRNFARELSSVSFSNAIDRGSMFAASEAKLPEPAQASGEAVAAEPPSSAAHGHVSPAESQTAPEENKAPAAPAASGEAKPAGAAPLAAPVEPEPLESQPVARLQEEPPEVPVRELIRRIAESAENSKAEFPEQRILKAMRVLSKSDKAKHRAAAYKRIRAHFSDGKGQEYSQMDFVKGVSACLSLPAKDDQDILAGITVSEALLSLPQVGKWGPVESQELRSRLASADPRYTDPALLSKLKKGSEDEKGQALLVLVERAEINGRVLGEGASLYEVALTELVTMEEEHAVPALFSLADSDCPRPLLIEFLTAYEPAFSGGEAVNIILSKRAKAGNAVLASDLDPQEGISNEKALAAVRVLQFYGGGEFSGEYDSSLVAKGAANVRTAASVDFLIEGLNDAEEDEASAWKDSLREISSANSALAGDVQTKLASNFDRLSPAGREAAFGLLLERSSLTQAEFLISLAMGTEGQFPRRAEQALEHYDFSPLSSNDRFIIMGWMYLAKTPEGVGARRLKEFLPAHREDAAEWMDAQFLSGVFTDSDDRELAMAAREALVAASENILAAEEGVSGLGDILSAIPPRASTELSELAVYSLASEMRRQGGKFSPEFHKALFKASRKFKENGDEDAISGIILAARAAATEEAMRQILVPYLAAEEKFSSFAAASLLSTEEGARQLALAAAMENHPAGVGEEGSLLISRNAFRALSEADTELSSRALISLLKSRKRDLHLSAYGALQNAGGSKCPALLELLSSEDSWERYAATTLLPQKEAFIPKVLPLSIDQDSSVSASAMEYILSVSGANGLASILSNPGIQEEVQYALSNYCAASKPELLGEMLALAQLGLKETEVAIRALEFFPTDVSFPALLSIIDSGKPTAETARETFANICLLLSSNAEGEDAENAAYDLIEVYLSTADQGVRNAVIDSARWSFAKFILDDAVENIGHAEAALEIFLATENIQYAAEAAQCIMAKPSFPPGYAEGLPPLWQALFFHDLEKMAEVKPGTTEYKVLQEVAEQEFVYGRGSRESKELLFSFMKNFGSSQVRDSLFGRGPLAVSEFLWSMRGDPNEAKAVLWLRSMKDGDANLLLDVLSSRNYAALDRLLENPELSEAAISHAMRRALFSFAEMSLENPDEGKAREGLELYAQLLSREASIGLPSERADQAAALQKNIGLLGMISEEGAAKGRQMLLSMHEGLLENAPLRAAARADARKLARKGPIEPERPLRRVRRVPNPGKAQ